MKLRLAAGIGAAAILGSVLAAGPAFAANPGGSSNITGTIQVGTTLEFTTTLGNFTLTSANETPATAVDPGSFTVTTNDTAGYFVDIQGPPQFGSASTGIPTGDVSYSSAQGSAVWTPLSATPAQILASGSASAGSGDTYGDAGFYLNSLPGTAAPGNDSGQITFTLWGN